MERDNATSDYRREGALVTLVMHGGDGGFDSDVVVSLMEVGECGQYLFDNMEEEEMKLSFYMCLH